MKSISGWMKSSVVASAFFAPAVGSSCPAQVLKVFQAEYSDRNTGSLYTAGGVSGVHGDWEDHPPGIIHYVGGISGLPGGRDLKAKFRLYKASTYHSYNTNNVALEVYSETHQKTIAHRVLKNLRGDDSQGYLDHHVSFRVNSPNEVISLRVFFYASYGSQTQLDLSYIGF